MASYPINYDYMLGDGEGSIYYTSPNKYIILHETATEASARNNASYFKNNWSVTNTYVTDVVGDGGIDYKVGSWGYVSWGAGQVANAVSPVQIELARTRDEAQFRKDYATYISLARDAANYYGIPLTLDGGGAGIKTHRWVSDNIWGDHIDPVDSYLQPYWGITHAQLASDLANGVNASQVAPSTAAPTQPVSHNVSTFPGFTPEIGTFTIGDQPIAVRQGQPGLYAPISGTLQPGDPGIIYDGYKNQDGYVWIHYIGYDGSDLFLPTHPSGTPNNLWGTFS